jgi:hypothetical protein
MSVVNFFEESEMKRMNEVRSGKRFTGRALVLFFFALVFFFSTGSAIAKEAGGFKWKAIAEVESAYSSNVFNLSTSQQDALEANSADDQLSGRYTDMEDVADIIISPAIDLRLKSKALSGKDLNIDAGFTYNQYMLNTEKSYPEIDFEVEQELGKGSAIGFEFAYKFDVFKKNYLSDAVDGDASLNITPDERVYSAGIYNSYEWDVVYKHRLLKNKNGASNSNVKKVTGSVLIGMANKSYDSPFTHKDSDTLRIGAGVDIELKEKTDIKISYLYESVDVPVASEVLIRDEDDFGVILNGDADATDQDVRTVQSVDRSRTNHSLEVKADKKLNKDWTGELSYALRFQDYSSNETYDVTRNGRTDTRHTFGAGLKTKYSKKISLDLNWKYVTETAKRSGLADIGETEDKPYNKHVLSAVVQYRL